MAEILEVNGPYDAYRDYCLWDYTPIAPTFRKLKPASLLWHSFEALNAPPALAEMVRTLRRELGEFQTVWAVKRIGDTYSWEIYFYDYDRLSRRVPIERVLQILSPFAASSVSLSPARPYFAFSLDLDVALGEGRRGIDVVNVYLGNVGSNVSSGICYELTNAGLRLDNLYFFFNPAKEWDTIVAKLGCSVHLDLVGLDVDQLLWPEMRQCSVIVVANKKHNDGVYFSRVNIDQLILFVDRLDYPASIRDFLRAERGRLDHLLFDVGIDYRMVDGRIEIVKSAYYSVV